MKETLAQQHFYVDSSFDTAEASNWSPPVSGEHVNILNAEGYVAEMPPDQPNRTRELQAEYVAREGDAGWRDMSQVLEYNLDLLEHASVDDFDDSQNRSSSLMLSTLDMLDDRAMNQGHDMRYAGQYSPIALRNVSGNELPEQTQTMLDDLYSLTGAKVFRDDRNGPDEKDYRRYLIGNFQGKQLMFTEHSVVPNYEPGLERQLMVSVTDDMERLKELSLDEIEDIYDDVGLRVYGLDKEELPEVRRMKDEGGAEIDHLTAEKQKKTH